MGRVPVDPRAPIESTPAIISRSTNRMKVASAMPSCLACVRGKALRPVNLMELFFQNTITIIRIPTAGKAKRIIFRSMLARMERRHQSDGVAMPAGRSAFGRMVNVGLC